MNGRTAFAGLVCIAAMAAGCASDPYAQWKDLDVVYARQVPIYPGAVVEDAMGGRRYGEDEDDLVSESITYWFTMSPTQRDEILAFYEKALPGAKRSFGTDGEVRFKVVPQGAAPGESVWVVVGRDVLKIGEETKPRRHKVS